MFYQIQVSKADMTGVTHFRVVVRYENGQIINIHEANYYTLQPILQHQKYLSNGAHIHCKVTP